MISQSSQASPVFAATLIDSTFHIFWLWVRAGSRPSHGGLVATPNLKLQQLQNVSTLFTGIAIPVTSALVFTRENIFKR